MVGLRAEGESSSGTDLGIAAAIGESFARRERMLHPQTVMIQLSQPFCMHTSGREQEGGEKAGSRRICMSLDSPGSPATHGKNDVLPTIARAVMR